MRKLSFTKVIITGLCVIFSDNHSRVKLNVHNNTPTTDYINANYIDVSIHKGYDS